MNLEDTSERTKPISILLVEDDDADAKMVRRAFRKARIPIEKTRVIDGVEALETLRGEGAVGMREPFIMLVDINMPRMDGHELVQEIRNDPALEHHIVFMLTTSDSPSDISDAYKNHVAGYIIKQHAGNDLVRLVDLIDNYWHTVEFLGKKFV